MPTATLLRTEPDARTRALGEAIARLAEDALRREMELTPKPGLVDRANAGAHRDMDLSHFRLSLAAIAPWFGIFFDRGVRDAAVDAADCLPGLRAEGRSCETAMLRATDGINTHKGSVFAFGLLCAAGGRLHGRRAALNVSGLCAEVARLCDGLVERELAGATAARTAGEHQFRHHGITGPRGEAASGYATARRHGLAPYLRARAAGLDEERALWEALLHLLAHNVDSNLVARGGLPALALVQGRARRLLQGTTPPAEVRAAQLAALDHELIERHLSPGGSADLLAVSWFLAHLGTLPALADS